MSDASDFPTVSYELQRNTRERGGDSTLFPQISIKTRQSGLSQMRTRTRKWVRLYVYAYVYEYAYESV